MNLADIDTPAVVIDETIALNNINTYQAYCDKHGLALRPHIKTHKLPHFAQAQLQAGAIGITCQKVSEAEVMADAGIKDILITYNILGKAKLERLVALAQKLEKLAVVADNEITIRGLSVAFNNNPIPLDVLVECDTGAGRCGVQSPDQAVGLAEKITASSGLNFRGLMTYPRVGGGARVQEFMSNTLNLLRTRGIDCPVISSGGSPDMWRAQDVPVVTEYRIGTYIYNDRSLVEGNVREWSDCALSVLATVVSTPTPSRAVVDAGSKILTSDLIGLSHHGYVVGHPNLEITSLSEEHGVITTTAQSTGPAVGDRIHIIPNHCCVVSNMVDRVWLKSGTESIQPMPVAARGCVV